MPCLQDTLNERMKLYRLWKDAEATLAKKQEAKAKLEQQRKLDKVDLAEQEIQEVSFFIKTSIFLFQPLCYFMFFSSS